MLIAKSIALAVLGGGLGGLSPNPKLAPPKLNAAFYWKIERFKKLNIQTLFSI